MISTHILKSHFKPEIILQIQCPIKCYALLNYMENDRNHIIFNSVLSIVNIQYKYISRYSWAKRVWEFLWGRSWMCSALSRPFVCFRTQMLVENELEKHLRNCIMINWTAGEWKRNIWDYRAVLYIGSPFLYHKIRLLGKWILATFLCRDEWPTYSCSLTDMLSLNILSFYKNVSHVNIQHVFL